MIPFYRLVTYLAYLALYTFARRRALRGDLLWQGRLGLNLPTQPVDIWMHAASVGEVKVLNNLVSWLQKARPELKIHVTAVTRTGLEAAISIFGGSATVSAFPLDATPVIERTLDSLRPRMMIVAETEIWPNLIRLASERAIPLVLVNGRMTERSMRRYKPFAGSLKRLLAKYDRFFFKSEIDRERYAQFGVLTDKTEVTGDMKFDAASTPNSDETVGELRQRLGIGDDHFLLLAGSTRPGEEAMLMKVLREIKEVYPQFRLGLAPRHLERLPEIEKLICGSGLLFCCVDQNEPCKDITLVDRMGILSDLYAAADLAFVGGTLVDVGGHNILEPVWAGTPAVFGPYLSNVNEAAEYIEGHNYGTRVESVEELRSLVEDVISGRREFAARNDADLEQSATAAVGKYILERIADV